MTLTKNKMVREIGRRTRLKNHDVQAMIEALVEVWTDELVGGGRIELENFLVLEIKEIDRGINGGTLRSNGRSYSAPRFIYKLVVRPSKKLKSNFISKRNET
jgi:nucleoid DNA-binding protein